MLFWLIAGYILGVVLPIPGLSRWIVDVWAKVWDWIKEKLS